MGDLAGCKSVTADHESVWQQSRFPYLENLEAVLRCPICQEFMQTPSSLSSCGHHFCSLCISRWLESNHSDCPSCRKPQEVKSAQYSRSMDVIVSSFVKARPELLQLTLEGSEVELKDLKEEDSTKSPLKLGSGNEGEEGSALQRMPKLNYTCLSDKQLKAKLREIEIVPDSTREVNEFVHKEYTLRYNAACSGDQSKMPAPAELRKQVLNAKRHRFSSKGKGILQFTKRKATETSPNGEGVSDVKMRGFQEMAKELHRKKKRDREVREKQWRVVYSDRCKRPFYYNIASGVGQFEKPKDLKHRTFDVEAVKSAQLKKKKKTVESKKGEPVPIKENESGSEVVVVEVKEAEEKALVEDERKGECFRPSVETIGDSYLWLRQASRGRGIHQTAGDVDLSTMHLHQPAEERYSMSNM